MKEHYSGLSDRKISKMHQISKKANYLKVLIGAQSVNSATYAFQSVGEGVLEK